MRRRARLHVALAALLGCASPALAVPLAPGDTSSVVLLSANFDSDAAGLPPNVSLPTPPSGDYLTLDQSGGSTLVQSSVDGLSYPVVLRQENSPDPVALEAWLAPRAAGLERMTVRWRSLARDDNPIYLLSCALRSPTGSLIASVSYNPHSELSYNGPSGIGSTLPVEYLLNRNQQFTVQVDFLAGTTSLSIDGAPVPGFQGVPFAEPAGDLARVGFDVGASHPQTFAVDDVSAVAFFRTPDHAPVVTAPASVAGSEGAALRFTVSASDPDGQAILSLDAAPLPAGAAFTPDAAHAAGTFDWTPGYSQAGTYSVTFTAANTLSGSASTAIDIASVDRPPVVTAPVVVDGEEGGTLIFTVSAGDPDGETISSLTADLSLLPAGNDAAFTPDAGNAAGTFLWHMRPGDGGSYPVAFTASNGITGVAYTRINVAYSGTNVTGELIWTPAAGMEGLYDVTFTATDQYGESSTAVTQITILTGPPPAAAAQAASRADARPAPRIAEAPEKGPIISCPRNAIGYTGSTLTVEATATEPGGALLVRSLVARAASLAAADLTLTADLSQLPEGNDAVFAVDRDPEVGAPVYAFGDVGSPLSFGVTASDPDGEAIYSLAADLSTLPSGSGATFTPNGSNTAGLFEWTPALGDSGNYTVTFTALNELVAHASTTIRVRGVAVATAYTVDKKIRLSSNKPIVSVVIEPLDASFDVGSVLIPSVRLVSPGTGSVSEISVGGKTAVQGDRDKDQVPDLTVSFLKADVRALFSLLRGTVDVPVTIEGQLLSGRRFAGLFTVTVAAGSGALQATLSPNPFNPSAQLVFYTERPGPLRVRVFDSSGRLVRELMDVAAAPAGEHALTVDGRGRDGRALASGVYFYRVESAQGVDAGRFTILK